MINLNLRLKLPITKIENDTVITVYFKNRTNIIGTCSLEQDGNDIRGSFNIAEELHDDLYVLYVYGSANDTVILDGILFDDSPHNKSISTIGSSKLA